jgi:hypothetical protein
MTRAKRNSFAFVFALSQFRTSFSSRVQTFQAKTISRGEHREKIPNLSATSASPREIKSLGALSVHDEKQQILNERGGQA